MRNVHKHNKLYDSLLPIVELWINTVWRSDSFHTYFFSKIFPTYSKSNLGSLHTTTQNEQQHNNKIQHVAALATRVNGTRKVH